MKSTVCAQYKHCSFSKWHRHTYVFVYATRILLLLLFVVVYELSLALACAFVLYFAYSVVSTFANFSGPYSTEFALHLFVYLLFGILCYRMEKTCTHTKRRSVIGLSLSVSMSMEIHSGFSGFICLVYVFWWHFFQKYTVFVFSIYSISIGSLCFCCCSWTTWTRKISFFLWPYIMVRISQENITKTGKPNRMQIFSLLSLFLSHFRVFMALHLWLFCKHRKNTRAK